MDFGLYLKKKGVITAEQLVSALEAQMKSRIPIGQIPLEEGILAPRDIFKVLLAQNDSPNVRFGDLAVEMGLMTRDDVMRLLMIQGDRKRPVATILVSQGVLSEHQLEEELAAYRRSLLRPERGTTMTIVPAPRKRAEGRSTAGATAAV